MHKVFEVFKRDLLRVLRNPVALLVVGGICVVPCLYAWINVLANWDPYENTSGVSVAVVTEDQPVEMQEAGTICVGDMMVDALKDNDKVGWQFLGTRDEAMEGVRSGDYYAAIIIPDNFTKELTGILDGNTDKAHLIYYVNEKVNPVTPKVADTVASTVQNEIDGQFTAKVGEVIAQKLGGFSGEAIDKAQNTVDRGVFVLDDISLTLTNVDTELGQISGKLQAAQTALTSAADSAAGLSGLGARVSGGLADTLNGVANTRANANSLISQINTALGNGASTISSLSSRANYDVSTIAGDIAMAQAQVNAAIRALESDLTDSESLSTKLTDAYNLVVSIQPTDESAETMRLDLEGEISRERDLMVQISSEQQAKLDNIIGVRSDLIEALRAEFENSNVHIAVDEKTGAITFDSSILFEYNASELKPSGEQFLKEFLPRYVSILLGPEYREYISEIIIEGHTDNEGTYIYNLDLSQERAYSVAEYCLSDDSGILNKSTLERLREVVSCTGRSYSDPILDDKGKVDQEASRRVEFLFRLKDEEMIREMIEILSGDAES